jgi:hypothetical protein
MQKTADFCRKNGPFGTKNVASVRNWQPMAVSQQADRERR